MPGGPLAHICFVVRDLDKAVADWTTILRELDPAQLSEPVVRVDRWEAGGDVMSSATFVNPAGCEIQLLCPLNDGPLGKRLSKRGEHVHHVCFTSPDLPGAVARLAEQGIELTSTELQNDPKIPWQHWTFISPASSHGTLVELAYPYEPVDGEWRPGPGAPLPAS
ncbi:MAG: methylmalonyl-CoA epimerase [Actinobacteria bacterium]|nr:methylmalonyl-CoA epimerase [Actinomycetota bacterium]